VSAVFHITCWRWEVDMTATVHQDADRCLKL